MLCCKADPKNRRGQHLYVCMHIQEAGSRTLLSSTRLAAACKNKTRESVHCIKIPRAGRLLICELASSRLPMQCLHEVARVPIKLHGQAHTHAHTAQASPSVSKVCVSVSQQRASASSLAQRLSILAATIAREGSQTFRLFFDTGATNHSGG